MATNTYLKFENPAIKGDVTAAGHEGEIEVLSWGRGSIGPGRSIEEVNPETVSFTKYLDSSTKELTNAIYKGKEIGKATLTCYRSDGARDGRPVVYLTVVMERVKVANYSVSLSGGGGDMPVETVMLDYGTVKYNYKEQKRDDDLS